MRQNKPFKALMIHLLNLSMLIAPMPLLSAESDFDSNVNSSDWVGDVGTALKTVGGALLQSRQQQAAMRQQALMMRNSRPQTVPAKFFPQCQISPAGAQIPKMACEMSQNLPGVVSQGQQMTLIAQQNIDFYDQLMDEAQNSRMPNGIACLNQALAGVRSSISDRMNGLERMKEQIKKANQLFEEQNKAILEDIKRNGNELFGAKRGKKLDSNQETADYNKLVSPECRDIIVTGGGGSMNDQIFSDGLRGIRDGSLGKLNISSAQFVANRGSYERDLNQKVQQIKKDIRKFGVDGFLQQNSGGNLSFERNGQEKFGSLQKAFSDFTRVKQTEVRNIKSSITKEIPGVDISSLTNMGQDFKADFGEFVSQAEQQLKRQAISACVSGPVGLSPDQILSSLRYDSTSMTGDTINNYRSALDIILKNPDSSPSEKESDIKKLDARFKGRIRIVYNDEDSVQRNESPYQMFQKIVKKCDKQFEQETDNNIGRSTKKKIARAKKYMQQLQAVERTFATDLANQLIDEVVNCSGRSLKAGQCSAGTLSTSNNEFCLAQATDCAAQAGSCFAQIDREVKIRQDNMNKLSVTYNNNVAALISNQEALLAQVKAQVGRDAEFFKSFFPGATYNYPEDLFVKMPQLADFNGLGVELRGGGNIEDLQKLPGKIDLLKQQLEEQFQGPNGIEKVINDYIAQQKGAMEKNKGKWAELQQKCQQNMGKAQQAIAEANKRAQEAYGEKKEKVNEFCQKFENLRDNPAAGCGDDNDAKDLFEDSMKISSHVSDDARRWVGTYKNLCAQSQNEKDNSSDEFEDGGKDYIKEQCEESDSESILSDIDSQLKTYGDLSDEQIAVIESAESTGQANVKEIIEANEGNSALITLIKKRIALSKASTNASNRYEEFFKDDTPNAALLAIITDGIHEEKMAKIAIKEARKIKDKGFCSLTKIESLISATEKATSTESIKFENKIENTSAMRTAGRAIASLKQNTARDPLSAMGQAEYQDIDCEATASAGRFSDAFDFSLDPMGQSSQLGNFSLGK
ncbi:MAG: hypothetical protein CME70_24035 [Halobacteriovorax sp.]|nr:hypothetical protein [Halobacteriovorax sp.]|tara:strand:+ start:2797 stop:5889 length:3093 start_codon:yes stop_codon:yes gene_type:complete